MLENILTAIRRDGYTVVDDLPCGVGFVGNQNRLASTAGWLEVSIENITLALLGFLSLEYERMRGLQKRSASAEPRGGWATARTATLLQTVCQEALRGDVKWQQECLKTPSGRRRLKKALAKAA